MKGAVYPLTKTETVYADMRNAMKYVDKAKPIIAKLLNGGEVLRVEGEDNDVCKMLDQTCGTDYFQVYKGKNIVWGVASRFQRIPSGRDPYNTFTIRKERESGGKTELEKRKYAIEHNGVYPFLTLQAYYRDVDGEIMSLGIAKTTDVMKAAESKMASERKTGEDKIGQAVFICVKWSDMIRNGMDVRIYEGKSG